MKISVDVDCTPEEARAFMGLPDLSAVHAAYVEKLKHGIEAGLTPETLLQNWAPMGEAGLALWRQLVEQMGGGGTSRT
jgi:hypothetical protein